MTQTATGAPSTGNSTPTRRRGSAFTDRQIARSVKDERMVFVGKTSHPDDQIALGWVCGFDDYHWGIVDFDGVVHMVHKTAPVITVLPETLADCKTEVREAVRAVTGSFRRWTLAHQFGQSDTPFPTDN